METSSTLLAICAGNSQVPGEFSARRAVTRSFGVFFDLRLNKLLSKQSWGWWFETLPCPLWRHSDAISWPPGRISGTCAVSICLTVDDSFYPLRIIACVGDMVGFVSIILHRPNGVCRPGLHLLKPGYTLINCSNIQLGICQYRVGNVIINCQVTCTIKTKCVSNSIYHSTKSPKSDPSQKLTVMILHDYFISMYYSIMEMIAMYNRLT